MSIASEISRLQTAKADLKTAIEGKGVTVPSSTKLDGYADLVDSIETGGGGGSENPITTQENDVTFYDYDGTIVASYSAADFANLTSLPNNPDHTSEGLTAQGWNWSLSDAKTYVASYNKLNIGQMYITTDNATKFYIDTSEWYLLDIPCLRYTQTKANGVAIDWGDYTATQRTAGTGAKTVKHTYENKGNYIISFLQDNDCTLTFSNSSSNTIFCSTPNSGGVKIQKVLNKIQIGKNTTLSDYAFHLCFSLSNIPMPTTITALGQYSFYKCYNLNSIIIPNTVTSLGAYLFADCRTLKYVSLPRTINSISSRCFSDCSDLDSITIPNTVTKIDSYAFIGCYSLSNIIIPSSVTDIENYAFAHCGSLETLILADGIKNIKDYAFLYCSALNFVDLPSSIKTIGRNSFSSYKSPITFIIRATTPPTLNSVSNGGSFGYTTGIEGIYVPDESVETYKATYTGYASIIKGISERT